MPIHDTSFPSRRACSTVTLPLGGALPTPVLQCVAVCCGVLQCGAVRCSAVQCGAVCCSVCQCGAVWCSVVQCGAVWYSVVQCGVVWCSAGCTLPPCVCTCEREALVRPECEGLKFRTVSQTLRIRERMIDKPRTYTATHCNTLQHTYPWNTMKFIHTH